jgi:hypothetical protein
MTTSNIYDLADTWNDGATTFTAIKMNVTDTASAAASKLLDLQVGGVSRFTVAKGGDVIAVSLSTGVISPTASNGWTAIGGGFSGVGSEFKTAWIGGASSQFKMRSDALFGWTATTNVNSTAAMDIILSRDAADTLAQRRGTNAQAHNIYNTYTDASNYERARMGWAGNAFQISTENVGTGSLRPMELKASRIELGRSNLSGNDFALVPRASNVLDFTQAGGGAPLYQFTAGLLKQRSNYQFAWVSGNDANTASDTGIARDAAGVVRVTDGSTGGGAMQLTEMTAPSAPAADNVRVYAEDDGAGKTRLMARFATGAAVQIAIEP